MEEILNPMSVLAKNPSTQYLIDMGQRSILYWDVMRQRGNQYQEHIAKEKPHVLGFKYTVEIDGRTLPKPVNYWLAKITPENEADTDQYKRPIVIVDPRAGHGPGIGGFKADSEIGVALKTGHACYFIGFLPEPEPEQTIEDIMHAEAFFLERVIELHPKAEGKPMVIGNCQAGWAVMMLAAIKPELCGPILVAGSPLSYWSGVRGQNPMRYTGGLLGGSWLTALTGDMGNGKFDGAWLVQNFENLNPANTFWSKQYNLYKKIDTEAPRYLGFERWWGGHVVLNSKEMQYIVDNLFVGNKLSNAEMISKEGIRIDMRKIQSPIICFCSKGDNITPPQQALGWILDLYDSVDDIRANRQTIVYAVHENIGHLGIFVSGSVAKKEHQEFTENIDLIDVLPPGLYEAVMLDKGPDQANIDLAASDYISRFEARTLDDIRALGSNSEEEDRCFATAARVSEINHGLYKTTLQPFVKAMANEQTAEWLRYMHPLRLAYSAFSDENPMMKPIADAASKMEEYRQHVDRDNPFLQIQSFFSEFMTDCLDSFRDWSEIASEAFFWGIYSQPWLQAAVGLHGSDGPSRRRPGQNPEQIAFVKRRIKELLSGIVNGGPREAALRALIYIRMPVSAVDERGFEMLRRIRKERASDITLDEFKIIIREQFFMLLLDERKAVEAIPVLLQGHEDEAPGLLEDIKKVARAGGALPAESKKRLAEITPYFSVK